MSRVIVYHGPDGYQLDQAIEADIQAYLPQSVRDWNFEIIDGHDVKLERIYIVADSAPFLHDCRVTLVKEPDFFGEKNKGGKLSEIQEAFLKYAQQANQSNILLIRYLHDDVPNKFLKKLSEVVEVKHIAAHQSHSLSEWIQERAISQGKSFTQDARAYLIEYGSHIKTAQLAQELEKIFISYPHQPQISRQDIVGLLTPVPAHTVFNLQDYILAGRLDKSLEIWADLKAMREQPGSIIYRLTDYLKTLLAVQAMLQEGRTQKDMTGRLKKHPYVIKKSISIVRQMDTRILLKSLDCLLQHALASREVQGASEEERFEETLARLCAIFQMKKRKG